MRSFVFDLRCPECDEIVAKDLDFTTDVPPVPCMNPDSPAYSDPGSTGGTGDFPSECPNCHTKITAQYAYEVGEDAFRDDERARYEDWADRQYDDWRERDY